MTASSLRFTLLLIFIAVPLLEIALLIKAGETFGFWPTFGLVVATAILGSFMLRQQGLSVILRARESLASGEIPVEPVIDGVFLLLAGAFLITPGIATDALGLALLLPAVRRWLTRAVISRTIRSFGVDPGASGKAKPGDHGGPQGIVIEADYKRIDEATVDKDRRSH